MLDYLQLPSVKVVKKVDVSTYLYLFISSRSSTTGIWREIEINGLLAVSCDVEIIYQPRICGTAVGRYISAIQHNVGSYLTLSINFSYSYIS